MRFERAVFAEGFRPGTEFELQKDFEILAFALRKDEISILERAVTNQVFFKDFLRTAERKIEHELKHRCGPIMSGLQCGWYLLGYQASASWQAKAKISAEFFVLHAASKQCFTIKLEQGKLSNYFLELRFRWIIRKLFSRRFKKLYFIKFFREGK